MKDARDTNVTRLNEWAAFSGQENPRKWLAEKMVCSMSTVNQMFRGVTPGTVLRIRACHATGITEAELFPVFEAENESA